MYYRGRGKCIKQSVEEGSLVYDFNGAADDRRRTICRKEFAISCFIDLVLSFKIEESTVQIPFNFSEW